jgi:hypothetical protein
MRFTDIKDSIVSIMRQNLANQQSGKATDASILNPFVVGEPGIGKTCCVNDAKKILGDDWGIFPYRLAEQEPTILDGMNIPNKEGTRVIKAEPDWHHEIWKLKAQGFDKGIFFLDEVAEADAQTINVARQLVLGLGVGQYKLPEGWFVVLAGNRVKDKAGAKRLPSHFRDCLVYLFADADLEDTCNHGAESGWDFKVYSYLRARGGEFFCKNDPLADCNSNPRSWERVSNTLKLQGLTGAVLQQIISGIVGESACADFIGFLKIIKDVPEFLDLDNLIANAETARIPERPDVQYALCGALSLKANNSNMGKIIAYVSRLTSQEMAVVCIKDAVRRDNSFVKHPDVKAWLRSTGRELMI